MSIFSFFKKKKPENVELISSSKEEKYSAEYEEIPAFIETEPEEYRVVSIIATALAAGNYPESQFVIKKILKRNPEARTVSIIAASLAAGAFEETQFVVTKIAKKKQMEESHVTEI